MITSPILRPYFLDIPDFFVFVFTVQGGPIILASTCYFTLCFGTVEIDDILRNDEKIN
tara:strand:- start:274 stop:447 length:174 start_codon:yes stop_codon:yes gene_type:complete